MVEFSTSQKAKIAADIIAQLASSIGVFEANKWMQKPWPDLGPDCSPIMALKAGREQEVRVCAKLVAYQRKKGAK